MLSKVVRSLHADSPLPRRPLALPEHFSDPRFKSFMSRRMHSTLCSETPERAEVWVSDLQRSGAG